VLGRALLLITALAGDPIGESVITGHADDEERRAPIERADASPEAALDALPEVTLLRTGGPLAPARVDIRGLSGPRLGVSVAGLELGGPSSGLIDVGLVPWTGLAATTVRPGPSSGALGGRLLFEPLDASWPRAAARVGAGSLRTLELGLAAGAPFADGSVLVALDAARTDGNFVFRPSSPTGELRPPTTRLNNDQLRAAAMVGARTRILGLDASVLGLLGGREGGIPGFAAAPTDTLRGRRGIAGGRVTVGQRHRLWGSVVDAEAHASARVQHRGTRPASRRYWQAVNASSLSAGLRGAATELPWGARLNASVDVERLAIVEQPFRRTGVHASTSAAIAPWAWWQVTAALRGAWLSDVGPLWGGALTTSLGPRWLRVGASLSRAPRAPTLDELYAPSGLVVGNPDLGPEAANELEAFITTRPSRLFHARVAVFGGRLDDAILLVNRNAFEIAATNTGGLWRAGAEGELRLAPHRLVALSASGRWLGSRLDLTGAPLPVTPPLSGTTSLRLGAERGPHARLQTRFRSSSTGSLYGTVPVPGYVLTDLVGRWPISRHFLLVATLSNLFDTLSARDLNGLPLPGRQLFAAVEATL
jgi:hypothetical protein